MREDDLERLRESRALIVDRAAFGARFLAILRARPALDRLFRTDSGARAATSMVEALLEGRAAGDRMAALGRRHVGYGICETDFDDVGIALLATLRAELGGAYTPDVEQAWASAYGEMAEAMIASVALPAERQVRSEAEAEVHAVERVRAARPRGEAT